MYLKPGQSWNACNSRCSRRSVLSVLPVIATENREKKGEWVRIVGRPKQGLAVGGKLRAALEREFAEVAIS